MEADSSIVWPDLKAAREALECGDGEGVKVAIIDSGIDVGHPALSGLKLEDDVSVSCDGINLRIFEGVGGDVYGHGTAVASLVRREAIRPVVLSSQSVSIRRSIGGIKSSTVVSAVADCLAT